jgi:hypothetical protein
MVKIPSRKRHWTRLSQHECHNELPPTPALVRVKAITYNTDSFAELRYFLWHSKHDVIGALATAIVESMNKDPFEKWNKLVKIESPMIELVMLVIERWRSVPRLYYDLGRLVMADEL